MASFTERCQEIFNRSIADYHRWDDVDHLLENPYPISSIDALLYHKNWIDTVQWHLEDIIRNPSIDPVEALKIKRRIDASNQERTDMVEYIDGYFLDQYKEAKAQPDATINTETPAWAVDRLSILALKVYHMHAEATRYDASAEHQATCQTKLDTLLLQRKDLSSAIEELFSELASGRKYMKLYKQMKMYNDPSLNPILYSTLQK